MPKITIIHAKYVEKNYITKSIETLENMKITKLKKKCGYGINKTIKDIKSPLNT